MASFLENIFYTEKRDIDLNNKIELIRKEITKLKQNVSEEFEAKYQNLTPFLQPNEVLNDEGKKILNNLQTLQNSVDDQIENKLSHSSKELQKLTSELKEYQFVLNISSHLLKTYKCIEFLTNFKKQENKKYAEAATTLNTLNDYLKNTDSHIHNLMIYETLKNEYNKIHEDYINDLFKLWQGEVYWADESSQEFNLYSLTIKSHRDKIIDIVQALNIINKLNKNIESFSKKLLNCFISSIINSETQVNVVDKKIFSVKIIKKNQFPSCDSVLDSLKLLFNFLNEHFDFVIQEEHFLSKLSKVLFQEFSLILIKNCISKAIPTSEEELNTFKITTKKIEDFQNLLIKVHFIEERETFLSEFTQDIDNLYIYKKCEKLLAKARDIIKRDLHVYFKYESEAFIDPLNDTFNNNDMNLDKVFTQQMFGFPKCQVSKNAEELKILIEEIFEDICNGPDKYSIQLFYTIRNIIEMYAALSPEVHKAMLEIEKIPQQVALFHNNCWYLAHYLMTSTIKFKSKMSNHMQRNIRTFTDQVILLRQVGSRYFLNHMKYQRNMILNILRESELSLIGQSPKLLPDTQKILRQCIRQLELLKTVWIEVLPTNVYCRTLGCIINEMVDDLVYKIVALEDIPAEVASDLVLLFTVVTDRVPLIFPEPQTILRFVPKWSQFNELILILGATLRDIEERWADGKGPLALEFSPQQIRQLIRALFQNTEKRSSLLIKIKD